MTLLQTMAEVRRLRKSVDMHLAKIAELCGTPERREILVKSWSARLDLKHQVCSLDERIAELNAEETNAMNMKREEEQWNHCFDNGRLVP